VLAGATSLLAVGEWIADAPPQVLEGLGVCPDPVLPRRLVPAEATVRRLLTRIDGDALDRAVGGWLADRRPASAGLRGLSVDGKSLRGAARLRPATAGSACWGLRLRPAEEQRAGRRRSRGPGPSRCRHAVAFQHLLGDIKDLLRAARPDAFTRLAGRGVLALSRTSQQQ